MDTVLSSDRSLPLPRTPAQTGEASAVSRFAGAVARRVGGARPLQDLLDQVVEAVVELLGFEVAALNLTTEAGELEVVSVAGPPDVRAALLGSRDSVESWSTVLAAADRVGGLCFVDTDRVPTDSRTWVPDAPPAPVEAPDAWRPQDALFAPLHGADGALLGVLSVDLPVDGRRPDAHTCELLELFAVQASTALDSARVHARLARSEALFQCMFEQSPVGMAVFDAERRYVRVNPAYCAFMGRRPEELVGHTVREFSHADDEEAVERLSSRARSDDEGVRGVERRYLRPDGSVVWGRVSLTALTDEDGTERVLASVEDVTRARAVAAELERRAGSDPLTGLANRTTFDAVLASRLATGEPLAVLFCDVDRFKVVNDTLGHAAGDDLLQDVARNVSAVLRTQDLAARLGGDEFVLLLDRVRGAEDAVAVAERVRMAARRVVRLDDRSVMTSMTIGVALSEPGVTGKQLLSRADRALYRAKELGRDRVELARPSDQPPAQTTSGTAS